MEPTWHYGCNQQSRRQGALLVERRHSRLIHRLTLATELGQRAHRRAAAGRTRNALAAHRSAEVQVHMDVRVYCKLYLERAVRGMSTTGQGNLAVYQELTVVDIVQPMLSLAVASCTAVAAVAYYNLRCFCRKDHKLG